MSVGRRSIAPKQNYKWTLATDRTAYHIFWSRFNPGLTNRRASDYDEVHDKRIMAQGPRIIDDKSMPLC